MSSIVNGAEVLYWDLPISRGQNVRLLLSDAGIDFTDKFFKGKEFPAVKKQLAEAGINIGGTVPTVTLKDGRVIGQHRAFLRYVARLVGKGYYPQDDAERCLLVDEALDAVDDWRKLFGVPPRDVYEKQHRQLTLRAFEKLCSNKFGGPFLTGTACTIADLCIYQMLAENAHGNATAKDYPNLMRLFEAVKARPGVQALLKRQADAKKAGKAKM